MKGKVHAKQPNKKAGKKTTQNKKYPLRGKPVIYRNPFEGVAISDWEVLK